MTGTFLARKKLGSVLVDFYRGAHTPSTAWTKQQHIALLNGHLLGETATLHIALAGSNMLVNPVDALNHHFVLGGKCTQHPAGLGQVRVVAGNHRNQVVFANLHQNSLPKVPLIDRRDQCTILAFP